MTIEIDADTLTQIADMHAVYRMFDRTGGLLYVGVTGRARRFDEHAVKRWFPAVRHIALDWYATEAEARHVERVAIRTEEPRYNITGAPPPGQGILSVVDAPAPPACGRDVLADVLAVFADAPGLHWGVLAKRLAQRWPDRWADVTAESLSAQCRALGVPSVDVKAGGVTLKGCRKVALDRAAGL